MLRHVALFRWTADTTADDVTAIAEGLAGLPSAIPGIRDFRFGPDAGINAKTADFAVVADFDSADDYIVYRDHPAHRAFITDLIEPHLAERTSIQYEW